MALFLLNFFIIYGGAHFYFLRKLERACPLGPAGRMIVGLLLLLSTISPVLIRYAERHGQPGLALGMAYPGYFWMALLFLFFVSSVCWDLVRVINRLQRAVRGRPPLKAAGDGRQFLVCLGLALVCAGYGLYEAQAIRTDQIVIATPKLAPGSKLRIVQVSDVHLGILMGQKRLERIVKTAADARPEILVSTGDLIDGILTHDDQLARQFRQIRPRFGAYAVPGNHEYYVGLDRARQMTVDAGFTMLKGELAAAGPIVIAGTDDRTARRSGSYTPLPDRWPTEFTLLLKHQPRPLMERPFDLQLSGHVHKGQIFPFNLITWLAFRIPCGLTQLPGGRQIYVSRGTGTWGPPIRFLAPPEVTVIDLVGRN